MKKLSIIALVIAAMAGCKAPDNVIAEAPRPRTIVTTDGECDDYDSFIRLLLYSNEMDIEAIVYSASMWHWAGDGKGTLLLPENKVPGAAPGPFQRETQPQESMRWIGTQWVQDIISAYGECWPSLLRHDKRYPSPEYLQSIVKMGNIRVEGDMAEATEGSDYIKDILLDDKPGPVYAQIWGGANTVARALLSIEEAYKGTPEWEDIYRKVSDKLVLYIIQGQDGTYETYIAPNWPQVRTVYNGDQFFTVAYMWRPTVPEPGLGTLRGDWFKANILEGHGPLAAMYLTLGSGYDINDPADRYGDPQMVARQPGAQLYDFISEGDSPSFFFLMDSGLRGLEHPEWGGFGGRFNQDPENGRVWRDPRQPGGAMRFLRAPWGGGEQEELPKETFNRASGDYNPATGEVDMFYTQSRWVGFLQNDFAARADWCVKDYGDANHRPSVEVNGALNISARLGETVKLKGSATDPDGDSVHLTWWQYREAGTSDCELVIEGADTPSARVAIPADAIPGTTLHVILQATDDGTPALSYFQRIIITVD